MSTFSKHKGTWIIGVLGIVLFSATYWYFSTPEQPKPRARQPVVAVVEKTVDEIALEAFGASFKAERERIVSNVSQQKAEGSRLANEASLTPLLADIMKAVAAGGEVVTLTLPDKTAGLNADELENLTLRRRAYAEALAARLPEDTKIEGRLIYGACKVDTGCQMELRWRLDE